MKIFAGRFYMAVQDPKKIVSSVIFPALIVYFLCTDNH